MSSGAALNIFQEIQPITASCLAESGESLYFYGVAHITEWPFLKVQLPQSSSIDVKKVAQESQVLVYFEMDHSYLTLHTHVEQHINHKALVVRVEDYQRMKQKRVVSRAPAQEVLACYMPVDEQGLPLRKEKNRAEAVNLSKTGILIRMDEIFEPNQRLEINLSLPEVNLIHCVGRVVRLALHRTGIIESAIQFEDLTDHNRTKLGDYVAKISK